MRPFFRGGWPYHVRTFAVQSLGMRVRRIEDATDMCISPAKRVEEEKAPLDAHYVPEFDEAVIPPTTKYSRQTGQSTNTVDHRCALGDVYGTLSPPSPIGS